jgi:hypothetical protein
MLRSIVDVMKGSWNLVTSAVKFVIDGIVGVRRQIGSLIDRIPGVNIPSGMKAGNAADGFIPDAFRRELNAMPAGSQPVIANSSELILNRDQQAALLQPRSNSINFGGITINAGSTTNPRELASQVIAEIEARLNQAKFQLA